MQRLDLHDWHARQAARFLDVQGMEVVEHYGDPRAEYRALTESAGLLDLSYRSRLGVAGADRARFLQGQVTNDVASLDTGAGCYAALVNAKGKMQSDLYLHRLEEEFLLDFEPGFAGAVARHLERFIIAEDIQVVDVSPHFSVWSVQGPAAAEVVRALPMPVRVPAEHLSLTKQADASLGELYCVRHPRAAPDGYDLYVARPSMATMADRLLKALGAVGGRLCGWDALETTRIEQGLPRFGADMDTTNLPPEAGIESRAISYTKGCYTGQEVIARIRTYGQVAKTLRGLVIEPEPPTPPRRGDKLLREGKEAGHITSTVLSPRLNVRIALGYVRRECNQVGATLTLATAAGESHARIVELPFAKPSVG